MNHKIPTSNVSIQILDTDSGVSYRTTVPELQLGEDIVQGRALSARSLALKICNMIRKAEKTPAPINSMKSIVTFDLWDRENGTVTLESSPSYKDFLKRKDAGWPLSNSEKIAMSILKMIAVINRIERSKETITIN